MVKSIAKWVASQKAVGVPALLALRMVGMTASARRIAYLCKFAPQVISIRRNGFSFQMSGNGGQDQIPNRIWWHGWEHYEHPMPDLFVAFARQSRVIVDVGANSGFYTLIALSCSQAVVHAYEPFPPCQKVFATNLSFHPHANRARLHTAAAGEARGVTQLYIPLADHGLLETSCSLDPNFRKSLDSIEIDIVTLDDEFSGPEGNQIDLMKIDVEGAEDRVIAGARNLLARARPVIFVEILTDEYGARLRESFDGLGYNLFAIQDDRVAARSQFTRDPATQNYIAAPAERHAQFSQITSQVVRVDS